MIHTKMELPSHSPHKSPDRSLDRNLHKIGQYCRDQKKERMRCHAGYRPEGATESGESLLSFLEREILAPSDFFPSSQEKLPYTSQLQEDDLEKGDLNRRLIYMPSPQKQDLERLIRVAGASLGGVSALLLGYIHRIQEEWRLNSHSKDLSEVRSDHYTHNRDILTLVQPGSSPAIDLLDPMPPDIPTSWFLLAIGLYCVSVGRLYCQQPDTKYKDVTLVCGSAIGIGVGFLCGFGVQGIIFEVLPAAAWVSLLATLLYHIYGCQKGDPGTCRNCIE